MPDVILPNKSKGATDDNDFSDVYENDVAIKEVVEALDDSNIAAGAAIDPSKLAAITSRFLKPTAGSSFNSIDGGEDDISNAWTDVAGASFSVEPAVLSIILLVATFDFGQRVGDFNPDECSGRITVDGEWYGAETHFGWGATSAMEGGFVRGSATLLLTKELSAAKHTFKQQAFCTNNHSAIRPGTGMLYFLVAKP